MYPVLFKIGPVQVYSYGVMLALAFLVVAFLARRRALSLGMNGDDILDLCIWLIVSGLIGGRILFILLNLDYYRDNPIETVMLWRGGLVWYGGLIAAVAVAIIFLSAKKMPVLKTGDLMMPYVALGQSIGRIGCFLNGCCYGKAGHPTQLYESAAMFVVFLILRRRVPGNGRTFFLYLIMYSAFRFFIEFLRGDNPAVLMNLTVFQIMSIIILAISVILWKIIPSK